MDSEQAERIANALETIVDLLRRILFIVDHRE